METPLFQMIHHIISLIPSGKVATYGQIAEIVGGCSARMLGYAASAIPQGSDRSSIFRYDMHSLPNELESSIGTSTLFAAWNAAIYVGQVEDQRLEKIMQSRDYLDVTREVLRKYGGLWFFDESFIVSRKNE